MSCLDDQHIEYSENVDLDTLEQQTMCACKSGDDIPC